MVLGFLKLVKRHTYLFADIKILTTLDTYTLKLKYGKNNKFVVERRRNKVKVTTIVLNELRRVCENVAA